MIIFWLYGAVNTAYTVSFASITTEVTATYKVESFDVNLLYASTIVGYLIFAIPTDWMIDNIGVRKTIMISAVFNIIGLAIRLLIN